MEAVSGSAVMLSELLGLHFFWQSSFLTCTLGSSWGGVDTWVPAVHVQDPDEGPGLGLNQHMEDICRSPANPVSLCLSNLYKENMPVVNSTINDIHYH